MYRNEWESFNRRERHSQFEVGPFVFGEIHKFCLPYIVSRNKRVNCFLDSSVYPLSLSRESDLPVSSSTTMVSGPGPRGDVPVPTGNLLLRCLLYVGDDPYDPGLSPTCIGPKTEERWEDRGWNRRVTSLGRPSWRDLGPFMSDVPVDGG